MKTIKTLILVVIAGSALLVSSCNKDKDDGPSKTEMITANPWKLTAFTLDPPIEFLGVPFSDLYAMMDECSQDDRMIFNEDGIYQFDEGETKCEASDPQVVEAGTWDFGSDETELVITSAGGSMKYDINALSSSAFKISQSKDIGGTVYTTTMEMVADN